MIRDKNPTPPLANTLTGVVTTTCLNSDTEQRQGCSDVIMRTWKLFALYFYLPPSSPQENDLPHMAVTRHRSPRDFERLPGREPRHPAGPDRPAEARQREASELEGMSEIWDLNGLKWIKSSTSCDLCILAIINKYDSKCDLYLFVLNLFMEDKTNLTF